MNPNTINLHIDKIVLDSIGEYDEGKLSKVVQQELQRLIAVQGLHGSLHQPTTIKNIQAKPLSMVQTVGEKQLGRQLANSVYQGLRQ